MFLNAITISHFYLIYTNTTILSEINDKTSEILLFVEVSWNKCYPYHIKIYILVS